MTSTAKSAQGAILQIGTGSGGAKTITAIAIGNPTIITSTAHGFNNGDVVTFASIVGTIAAALNGLTFTVYNQTANTFAVQVNSLTLAYTSGGTATPTTFTAIANFKGFSGFDGQASEVDVTNFASTGKEFLLGLVDGGSLKCDLDIDNGDAGQIACHAAQNSSAIKSFKLILPTGATPTYSFTAFVKQFTTQGAVDAAVKGSLSLRISGGYTQS